MASKLTLLLITENPSVQHWMRKHLGDDCFLLEAKHLYAAVSFLNSTHLDFILLDDEIEDALEMASALKTANPITPILLITGTLKKSYRSEALDAGVSDFINHRLDLDEIETRFTVGLRAAAAREKTAELSPLIKRVEFSPSLALLKTKVLLHQAIAKILKETKKTGSSLSMLIVRIDRTQETKIQELLLALSERINRHLRPSDLLIPTDDHLVLLLPETDIPHAKAFAKQLCEAVAAAAFSLKGEQVPLTISIAVTGRFQTEEDYRRIVLSASEALQQATQQTSQIISFEL